MAAGWCAKMYEHENYGGWVEYAGITHNGIMTDARNDGVTSIKVQAGCTFTAYKDPNQEGLMTSITSDTSTLANNDASLDLNDQLSSYVCTCGGTL